MSTTHAPARRFSNIVNAGEADSRRWLVLATICFAALMIVLDVTVMNLALPSAQRALGFTNADRQWIVTAYSLTFGSLLLLFGRFGDLFGRKLGAHRLTFRFRQGLRIAGLGVDHHGVLHRNLL